MDNIRYFKRIELFLEKHLRSENSYILDEFLNYLEEETTSGR